MDKVLIDGQELRADSIPLFGAKLMVIQAKNGMLGCGYLNLATAEKLGHALAVVTGVACYDDMLRAEVKLVSETARALGVTPGMIGADALRKMN